MATAGHTDGDTRGGYLRLVGLAALVGIPAAVLASASAWLVTTALRPKERQERRAATDAG